ncbi:MAG: ribbon-helix-helix protein, CopG family [Thermaceae bacterium]|nr:ribbon-helix-helix protein, CopG family [Thermaceae bacterium]
MIHVYVDPDLAEEIAEAARARGLSVSAWVRSIVLEQLQKQEREEGES